jgi:hypothetical protein
MTTWTKLNDGSWGIRGDANTIRQGATVTVTKKSGESKTVQVAHVLWTGNGVAIAKVGTPTAAPRRSSSRMVTSCSKCRAIGDLCEECRFDEFDS